MSHRTMNDSVPDSDRAQPALRLWPGVVLVALQWLARFVVPAVAPEAMQIGVMAGMGMGLLVIVWFTFFSRASRLERFGGLALIVATLALTPQLLDASVATGMMGMMFPVYALPGLSLALVLWAWAARGLGTGPRRLALVVAILVACGLWTLVRTGGFTGDLDHDFAWRWAATAEDRLVAETADERLAGRADLAETGMGAEGSTPGWPGFRGADRDGVVSGLRIGTDWQSVPPTELWRRAIGPGWSSFAVAGDFFYTQEQRGEDEVIACYRLDNGEPVWRHGDPVRFWESNGGAGPRGTPTLAAGRVVALGATGIVNVLDAVDGSPIWSRNAAEETATEVPIWGFSGSPLVVGDTVYVAISGALMAYDLATGQPRWTGPSGGEGYSSPHLLTLGGIEQIVQLNGAGIVGVSPSDGAQLWQHEWGGYPIVQPALTAKGDLLVAVSDRSGIRRLAIGLGAGGWTVEERWTSIKLKPYSSDFVVHEGHAYGFDGGILAAIDLAEGKRQWKGGRYGLGQLILLAEQDLLLVLTEHGELALVSATPEEFDELALVPAIEGKTWNHPVLVGDTLLVRNGQEMVAFRLPLADA